MQTRVGRILRQGCFVLTVPGLMSPAWMPLASAQTTEAHGVSAPSTVATLPDSPGAALAKLQPAPLFDSQGSSPQTSSAQTSGTTTTGESQVQQPSQPAPQPSQKPVGTAAAEPTHANGIAASEPAGVAIAPAKQHRVRTIVIATGAIIGAGIAIGSVAALTAGTSSRPPGAR
jgi:hypothetical protein